MKIRITLFYFFLLIFLNAKSQIGISNNAPNNNPNHLINNVLVGGGVTVDVFDYDKDLSTSKLNIKYDIIVSNPPYVLSSEKEQMNKNVLDWEPHVALFVEDKEPLVFYKNIADIARNILNKNGKLYFEINERFGKEIVELLEKKGFVNIELKKDINDKDRMIKAMWK
jgi:release factor glutamine methyltransferase